MANNDPRAPGSLLQRITQRLEDLRRMLVAAGRAFKALGRGIQQVILLWITFSIVLHNNETLLRKAVELLAGS